MPDISGATVLDDLPESVIVGEILVRLPAEDVLRCRAVRKSWRRATTTHNFLIAHHRHQPVLPVIDLITHDDKFCERYLSALHDAGAGAASRNLRCQPILWFPNHSLVVHAACDGLLVFSSDGCEGPFDVCNPVTRWRAPLRLVPKPSHDHDKEISSIRIAGFYRHHPSGEYRVLYWIIWMSKEGDFAADLFVLTVGSNQPRPIGQPPSELWVMDGLTYSYDYSPVLYRGSLHWGVGRHYNAVSNIMVFDTVVEAFRWMQPPARLGPWASLLEMDSALAMCTSRNGIFMEIWVMQDYEAEVWALEHRINLSALEPSPPLPSRVRHAKYVRKISMLNERELLIEFHSLDWDCDIGGISMLTEHRTVKIAVRVLHCDIDGKFIGNVGYDEGEDNHVHVTSYRFRESIIPLPFFQIQEAYEKYEMQEEDDDEKYYSIWP